MFFLVLIQERTKENQGRKARPDGFPGGVTATRHNSPRLRRGSNSAARAFPRHVPPPTHLRVWLLCRFYLYQQRSTIPAFTSIAENAFPPLGLKTRIKDKKIQAGFKNLSAYWRIPEPVSLLADSRTCPPTGGTCQPTGGTCPDSGGFTLRQVLQ